MAASDGVCAVVLSPHQNNFAMPVRVQVHRGRPTPDPHGWEQICQVRLRVGESGTLMLSSPTMDETPCPVPPGRYIAEVAGTGFVNYGWPGTTEPGDRWRIRLWPDDGRPLDEHTRWHMPGYGVRPARPRTTDAPPPPAPAPDPALAPLLHANGGEYVARMDPTLATALVLADPATLRTAALHAARAALTASRLIERPWAAKVLAAAEARRPLPAGYATNAEPIVQAHADPDLPQLTVRSPKDPGSGYPEDADGIPIAAPPFALSALYSVLDHDPLHAATRGVPA